MKPNRLFLCWMLVAGMAVFSGCEGDANNKNSEDSSAKKNSDNREDVSDLVGKIEVDGSSTVFPMTTLAADGFKQTYPDVEVKVGESGTGGGFVRFSAGETQISDASRPIKQKEFAECQSNGVEFIELPVAYDGLTFVVHKENDWAKELTVDHLKAIFQEDGTATKWSDLNGDWPAEDIVIFAPGTASGTFDYAKEVLAKDGDMRSNMTTSENDNVIVSGVAGDKNAIGFFGASYYFENQDKLNSVAIVNPASGAAVSPTSETIESGEYAPFSRPLFIYVNKEAANRPEVQAFVKYYLNEAGRVAQERSYVGLPEEIYTRARANFLNKAAGTHFLNAEGEHRKGSLEDVFVSENLVNAAQ
ncbi:MAG: PstS family phosphate ABC transporter substrate-binding protein [Pirellulales bacterium]|nr:PstS family phosphate ABC transporter substrate-binding protein [Pirellulales bacterium]